MWLEIIALLVLLCSLYFSWKLFAALLLIFFLFYRLITKNFDYWEKLGVPYKQPHFPWGSIDFLKDQKNQALQYRIWNLGPSSKKLHKGEIWDFRIK